MSEQSQSNSGSSGVLDTGEAQKSWRDDIPAEIKDSSVMSNVKDVADMANQLVNLNKLMGQTSAKDVLKIPGEDASQEDLAKFYEKLGRPEKSSDYKIELSSDAKTVGVTEKDIEVLKSTCYNAGLNNQQTEKIFEALVNTNKEIFSASTKQKEIDKESWKQELSQHYGSNLDTCMGLAQRGLDWAGDDVKEFLRTQDLSSFPPLVKFFARVGETMKEHTTDSDSPRQGGMTPEFAQQEITNLYANKDFLEQYTDIRNPGYKSAQERMAKLFDISSPR